MILAVKEAACCLRKVLFSKIIAMIFADLKKIFTLKVFFSRFDVALTNSLVHLQTFPSLLFFITTL